eukprot:8403485-Alexandrium_andersonii.AAC.1
MPRCQLYVLSAGTIVPGGLPGREGGLDEWADGSNRDGFDQPAKGGRGHERALPFRPRAVALLRNPHQQLGVGAGKGVQTGRPVVGS